MRSASRCACRTPGTGASSTRPTAASTAASCTATGGNGGGGPLTNALQQGFAVISSDAGHNGCAEPDLRHRPAGPPRLRLPGRRQADADGQEPDPDRLRQGPGSLVLRRLLERRPPHHRRCRALRRPVRRLSSSATRAIACRSPRSPTSPATSAMRRVATNPADPSTGFTAAERALVAERRAREVRRARRRDRRPDPGHQGVPSGVRPEPRRAHLHRRARRHLPVGAAQKTAIGKRFSGATTSTGTKIYSSFPYDNGRRRQRDPAFWKFTAPPILDSGDVGVHLAGAAGESGDVQRPGVRVDRQHRRPVREDPGHQRDLHRELAAFMTPPNPTDLVGAEEPRREADGLPRHQRSDLLERRHDALVRRRCAPRTAATPRNFARFFRVPGMSHCSRRPGDRSVRHADAARQLGREGRDARTASSPARAVPATPAASTPTCRPPGPRTGRVRSAPIRRSRATAAAAASTPRRASPASDVLTFWRTLRGGRHGGSRGGPASP